MRKGQLHTKETKLKLRLLNKGRKNPHNLEWNRNISNSLKGRVSSFLGKSHTEEARRKIAIANSGPKNHHWKGEKVKYRALHQWVYSVKGAPLICEQCGVKKSTNYQIHWANVDGKYQRVENAWIRLCVPCHRKFDLSRI